MRLLTYIGALLLLLAVWISLPSDRAEPKSASSQRPSIMVIDYSLHLIAKKPNGDIDTLLYSENDIGKGLQSDSTGMKSMRYFDKLDAVGPMDSIFIAWCDGNIEFYGMGESSLKTGAEDMP